MILLLKFELWRFFTGYRNTSNITYNSTGCGVEYCNRELNIPGGPAAGHGLPRARLSF